MTYPILLSFRNFRSRLSIYPGFYQMLKWSLYTSLQKVEDDSNFWLRESWSSEFIVDWTGKDFLFISPGRRLHQRTLKKWY